MVVLYAYHSCGFLHLRHLAFVIRFAQRLPFVVGMLTLAEGYLHLRQAFVVDEQLQRDDGLAGILRRFRQFAYLPFGEQQLTISFRLMIGVRPETVLGDMHLLDVQFPVFYSAVGVHERSLTFPDGLDLRTIEDDARRVAVQDDVLKLRLLVQYLYFRFQFHCFLL